MCVCIYVISSISCCNIAISCCIAMKTVVLGYLSFHYKNTSITQLLLTCKYYGSIRLCIIVSSKIDCCITSLDMYSWVAHVLLLLPLALSSLYQCSNGEVIHVNDNQTLESYLCGKGKSRLTHGTTLQLSTSSNYMLLTRYQDFCVLEHLIDLTITSGSSSSRATIKCVADGCLECDGVGIGFFNMSGLRLVNLQLIGCGAGIPTDVLQYVNDSDASPLYVAPEQKAVLVLNHCTNVQLLNITIKKFKGFGLLTVNLNGKNKFDNLIVAYTNGTMFYFLNSTLVGSSTYSSITITGAQFEHNVVKQAGPYFDLNQYYKTQAIGKQVVRQPLVGSAGVSFIFAQNFTADIIMNDSTSFGNAGSIAGGAYVLFLNHFGSSTVSIHHIQMRENYSLHRKGSCGMLVQFASIGQVMDANKSWVPLEITDSIFASNTPSFSSPEAVSGAIAIYQYVEMASNSSVVLRNVSFYNTSHQDSTCSCLCARFAVAELAGVTVSKAINLYLEDIVAINNGNGYVTSSNALFSFEALANVTIVGDRGCVFSDNHGSVIKARLTAVYLQGNLTFTNNRGLQGAVFHLADLAYLVLMEPLNATFTHNRAFYFGGVLYRYSTEDVNSVCVIHTDKAETINNIRVNFFNNTAMKSGNSIYAYPFYNCTLLNGYNNILSFYHRLFNFILTSNSALNQIASRAEKVCTCVQNGNMSRPDCDSKPSPSTVFAGSKVNFTICGVDAAGTIVYSPVTIRVYVLTTHGMFEKTAAAHIPDLEQSRELLENTCTDISVTILRSNDDDDIVNVTLAVAHLQEQPTHQFNIAIQPCPTGFVLNSTLGSCVCDPRLRALGHLSCQIDGRTVSGLSKGWLGLVNGTVGYSTVCQIEACNPRTTTVNLLLPDDICLNNRSGILCGGCQDNLSAVLGSYLCLSCSNYGPIYIIPLFALAGIVLVMLLMALRITVSSGTIVGLVFYANISQTNILPYITDEYWLFLRVIISFLSLDLGFPLCLFNGMTALHKSLLQFVFPLYLWLILLVIALIGRYSRPISKLLVHNITTQVLATLLFLSYSSLTGASLFGLIPAEVNIGNETELVWFFNGNVQYFSFAGGHIFLAILAIITMLLFVLPYTVIATVGVWMMRFRRFATYFKPLVDAHHAPYKDKWRFWFGVRLWVMLYAEVAYLVFRQIGYTLVHGLDLVVLVPFLLFQAYLHPYKNHILNLLDLFLMTNLTMAVLIITLVEERFRQMTALISAGITSITFLIIVAYHVFALCYVKVCLYRRQKYQEADPIVHEFSRGEPPAERIDSDNDDNRLRESLLGFVDAY